MTQQDESLITDEMRASIGKEGPPSHVEVDKLGIRQFARAVGHSDRVFYDEAYARDKGHRSIIAPPGYLGSPIYGPPSGESGPAAPDASGRRWREPKT